MGGQTPLPRQRPDSAGTRVGRFTLLDHFVSGAASDVWIAVRDGSRGIYLLKQLPPELLADPHAVRRLHREAAIAFRLEHPSFTRLIAAGDEGGRFCLATELVAGQSAAVVVHRAIEEKRPIPLDVALAIVTAVLDGLGHLHALRDEDGQPLDIVHRDLNVGNVIVGFGGDVKIIDFGSMQSRGSEAVTMPGVSLGTPETMAPEQAEGGNVDRRADLHAAAVLLHQLLGGRNPFAGSSVIDTLDKVRSVVPRNLSDVRSDVPRAFGDVVARALHKDPAKRPRDAAEMQRDLLEAAGVRPASKDAIARFMTTLLPDELARIRELIGRGQQIVDAMQDFMTEESIQQGAFTRTGVPMPSESSLAAESQVRTSIVRTRSGDELAPVIPLPLRSGSVATLMGRGAFTPSVMEMPGTAVVRVSGTQLVRDTRALRTEVERWRARFIAAIAVGAAGMLVVGVLVALWMSERGGPTSLDAPVLAPPADVAAAAPAAVGAARAEGETAPPVATAQPIATEAPARPAAAATSAKPRASAHASTAASPAGASAGAAAASGAPAATAAGKAAASPQAQVEPEAKPAVASPPPDQIAQLRRMLTKLQEQPKDSVAFDALVAEVTKIAANEPEPQRRRIMSDIHAAERSYEVEPLAAAISKLAASRR